MSEIKYTATFKRDAIGMIGWSDIEPRPEAKFGDARYFIKKAGRGNFKKHEVKLPYNKNADEVIIVEQIYNDYDETEIAQDIEQADNEHWEEQQERIRLQPDE